MQSITSEFLKSLQPIQLDDEVRLGSMGGDGGYVVPLRAINRSDLLISLGYGFNFSFEKHFLSQSQNKDVLLFESSINLRSALSQFFTDSYRRLLRQRGFPLFRVKQLLNLIQVLMTPRIIYHTKEVRKTATNKNQIAFETIMSTISRSDTVILKIDIEGAEYEILFNATKLTKINCLIIEFHDINRKMDLFLTILYQLRSHFVISHLHINNFVEQKDGVPDVIELTLINKLLLQKEELKTLKKVLPISLDRPCNPRIPDNEIIF